MKKLLMTFLLLLSSLTFTSCTEEEVDTITTIATLTYLYSVDYSHREHGTYYYRTNSCYTNHFYYYGGHQVYAYCRYYSSPSGHSSGYYITTSDYYSSIMVYR